jgi:diguanylate cyclase (GGDEF)-like protein
MHTLYRFLRSDYEVCMANSGQQALEFCETRSPDLILLDIVMPDMDGYEVCRRLRRNEPTAQIPVVFVTTERNPAAEVQALDNGATDFISNPFHEDVVKARVRSHLTSKFQADRLRSLALIDCLTGVPNRRQFDGALASQWAHCLRKISPLAVVMVDIDFFKQYNDTRGHQAGDACIQAVASTLAANLRRPQDLVARYGGEEFACILPDTPLGGALDKALELEHAIRALAIPHSKSDIAAVVTASFGVAAVTPTARTHPSALVAAADGMLYAAKLAGRGRVRSTGLGERSYAC